MPHQSKFAFTKVNYMIMLTGIVIIFIGLIVMTLDSETYGFGFLGLTLGPILLMLGFMIQFVAILYKAPGDKQADQPSK